MLRVDEVNKKRKMISWWAVEISEVIFQALNER